MWYGISGSWRTTNAEVESDVRTRVAEIMHHGDGIVSGGALGVDYFATDEALKRGAGADQLKIILPTPKKIFFSHFQNAANDGRITTDQAEELITQLAEIDSRGALYTMEFDVCNPETYYARNSEVIKASDVLLAFQVNASQGTQDAIDKAIELGLPVETNTYTI